MLYFSLYSKKADDQPLNTDHKCISHLKEDSTKEFFRAMFY